MSLICKNYRLFRINNNKNNSQDNRQHYYNKMKWKQ